MKTLLVATALFGVIVLAVGCGSSGSTGGDSDSNDVASDTRIFDRAAGLSSDDLVALGMKSGKEYDVSTLPGGVEAGSFVLACEQRGRRIRGPVLRDT